MIVRLRTNLGVTRLEVDATITIEELQRLVLQNLHIVGLAEEVSLAADLVGNTRYNDPSITLESAGIVHGCEIFVLGKFEKRAVEKAFVGEDGVLVPAGQTLVRIDVVKDTTENVSLKHVEESVSNVEAQSTTATPSAPVSMASRSEHSSANPSAAPILAPQDISSHPPPVWMNDYNALLDEQEGNGEEEEEELRAPDEVRRLNLLGEGSLESYDMSNTEAGGSLMQAVLLPEEQEQIDQLERALREAGFREYDVHLETQQLQDELIALRLQEEVAAHNTTHDALTAAFLAQRTADAAIHSHLNTIDATLARYHQQQRQLAAPDVLRLQQFQGVNKNKATEASKGATGSSNQTSVKPVVKPKSSVKPVKPAATAPVEPVKDRASTTDAAAVRTHRNLTPASYNTNTNTTQSRATATTATTTTTTTNNSTNNTISSTNTTGKSIKGRNPSKLLTEAMKNLEDVAIDLPSVDDVLTSHHATNNNTAPIPVPPRAHELELLSSRVTTTNSVKATRPSMLQQTALRSLTAPTTMPFTPGDAMMETEPTHTNTNDRSYQPTTFTPHTRYTNHTADIYHGEYGSSDILNDEDDEALLALLNPTRVTAYAPATTTATGADRKAHTNKPTARTQAVAASADNVPAGPALSLLGSGYKSMGQIKNEQRQQNAQQNTPLPLPAQKQKAPRSRTTTTTPTTTTHTVDTTTAKNSHKAKKEITNKTELDVLDETLALALQLSLEQNLPDSSKPVPTKPSRAKKDTPTVTTAAKTTTPSVQPSSQLKKNLFTRQPPSSSTGKAAERRQLQQRIVEKQALEDANRQLENDRRAAEDLQVQLDREAEATLLRQHLHANEYDHNRYESTSEYKGPTKSLPSWLQRKVDDGANQALLDLAAQQSFLYDQHREQQQQQLAQQQQRYQPAAAAVPVPMSVARRMPARPEYIPPALVVAPAPVPVPGPLPPAAPVHAPIAQPIPALRAPLNRPYQAAQQAPHPHADHALYNNNNGNDFYCPFGNNVGNNEMGADYMNMHVMYDEDDEMLARAIQDSLNDELY